MKGMGKAIRRYREEAGITQERLAELEICEIKISDKGCPFGTSAYL